jgi:hypothetical protein
MYPRIMDPLKRGICSAGLALQLPVSPQILSEYEITLEPFWTSKRRNLQPKLRSAVLSELS